MDWILDIDVVLRNIETNKSNAKLVKALEIMKEVIADQERRIGELERKVSHLSKSDVQ